MRALPEKAAFLAIAAGLIVGLVSACGDAMAFAKRGPAQTTGDLVAGEQGACMIDSDGRQRCLGASNRTAILSSNRFSAVSIGSFDITCGLKTDGSALCWGFSYPDPDVIAMAGPWRSVAAGGDFACGIHMDGRLQCWGKPAPAILLAPSAETYLQVSAGYASVCALRNDSTVACWASEANTGIENVPQGRFVEISVNDRYACGLGINGHLTCWGTNYNGRTDAPVDAGFVSVSAGYAHGCALRDTGQAVCWGDNGTGATTPLPGPYTDVSAGSNYSCGRRPNGTTVCWGNSSVYIRDLPSTTENFRAPIAQLALGGGEICAVDELGSSLCVMQKTAVQPPGGRFRAIGLNATGGCGIARDDRVACWGSFPAGVPAEPMTRLSLGTAHACAIRTDGTAFCWGDNSHGQANAPAGVFVEIAAADTYSCGLLHGGAIVCWGQAADIPTVPTGSGYRSLTANAKRACVHTADRHGQCWGPGAAEIPATFLNATWDAIANSEVMFCGLSVPNSIVCSRQDGGPATPIFSGGSFESLVADGTNVCTIDGNAKRRVRCNVVLFDGPMRVSGLGEIALGARHACNLRADGVISCLGDDSIGQRRAPAVLAKAIDVNADHACALGADHRLRCWGSDLHAESQPPAVALRDFDAGQLNGCGVATDGAAVCWGWNANGQGTVPANLFRQVATGLNHSCGIRDSGTLLCWGYGADGQTNAPAGDYFAVDVGERHSCAIASNGSLRCWGLNSEGQASPPVVAGETYRALSIGAFHGCAIRQDGGLRCWGRNTAGQSSPPQDGRFVDVNAGAVNSCAIREDGVRLCWGGNGDSQIPSMAFVSSALPPARYGAAYSTPLRVVGSSGYRPLAPVFRLVSGALPGGLVLGQDGLLSGTASALGQFTFDIEATDDNGVSVRQGFQLTAVRSRFTGGPLRPEQMQNAAAPDSSADAADTTPPVVTPVFEGTLGDENWYVSDVIVRWSITDPESAITETVGCRGTTVNYDRNMDVVDNCSASSAGGTTGMVLAFMRRDATPPTIGANLSSQPNAAGWHNTTVTMFYNCNDWLSGVVSCPANATEGGDGTAVFPAYTIRDHAGNTASTPQVTAKIDRTPPVVTITEEGTPNADGWYRDLTQHYACSDATSGLALPCPPPQAVTDTGWSVSAGTNVTDNAGNTTSAFRTYKVDRWLPALQNPTLPNPILLGSVLQVIPTAADDHSGLASAGCSPIDTATVGQKTLTCTATDRVGNTVTQTTPYTVAYDFVPTSAPLGGTSAYLVQAPRSVPFEWRLRDANGAPVANAMLVNSAATVVACPSTIVPLTTVPAGETNTFENFGDGRYRRNWWINYAGTAQCLRLDITLNDGITRSATIRVVPKIRRTGGPGQPQVATSAARSAPSSRPVATPRTTSAPARQPVKTRRDVQRAVKSRTR
ncbi:MAG: putative Ig domain-containing protein [Lysobacteraceae bacterium]